MKITILGAGAVGSVIGAALAESHSVTLVARPEHARQISRAGLRITGHDDRLVHPAATEELPASGPGDLLLVSVKAHAVHRALSGVADRVPKGTLVGLLANGLGVEEVAERALPGRRLVRVIVGIGATFREPGCVEHWDGPVLEQWGGPGLDFPATDEGREAMAACVEATCAQPGCLKISAATPASTSWTSGCVRRPFAVGGAAPARRKEARRAPPSASWPL